MSRADLRQAAYRYIQERLCHLSAGPCASDANLIPLAELVLLRDGATDPSEALVASLVQMFPGAAMEAEIYANLVQPFAADR